MFCAKEECCSLSNREFGLGKLRKTPKAVTRFTLLLTSREDPHALLLLGYCPCRATNKLQSHNSMVSVRPE